MARVGLIFGGRSVEHAVSVTSARTVARGLEAVGHEVVPLGIGPDGVWVEPAVAARALAGEIDRLPAAGGAILPSLAHLVSSRVEVVFPIVHGTWGEDGTLQGLLEIVDLPYVGAGVAASALAMHKVLAKRLFAAAGVAVVDYEATSRRAFEADPAAFLERLERLTPPLFVKPAIGGSSVGVRKVGERGDLEESIRFALRFDDDVLVERGVAGRELECAVLGDERLEASAIGEIVPGREFYDYEDKYLTDGARLIAPAELPGRARRAHAGDGDRRLRGPRRPRHGPGRLPARGVGDPLRQRGQHPARLYQHLHVPPPLGALGRPPARAGRPAGRDRPPAPPRPPPARPGHP